MDLNTIGKVSFAFTGHPVKTKKPGKVKLDSGFTNILTGLNTSKDRRSNYQYTLTQRVSYQSRIAMYRDSAISKKVVNAIVNDALRKQINIDNENADEIHQFIDNIQLVDLLNRGAKEARVHGGACIFWHINDGNLPDQPVDYTRIRSIEPAFIFNKEYIVPFTTNRQGNLIPWIEGHPVTHYAFGNQLLESSFQKWHRSRVMIFQGLYAGEDNRNNNNSWYESVINTYRKPILLYEIFCDSIGTISDNAIQEIIKLEGLQEDLEDGNRDLILEKITAMMSAKSVVNKILLDKADDYQYHNANLSGYKDIQDIAMTYLAASTSIPRTKLFGDSPAASIGSQAGTYEENTWYDEVQSYQKGIIKPNYNKFFNWIKPLLKMDQKEVINYNFQPLKQIDPLTESQIRLNQANIDSIYIASEVVTSEEIAINRFEGEYNINTNLLFEREANDTFELETEDIEDED